MGEVKREQECTTADDWRHRAYHLESEWARCSQACAVMQGERDALRAEVAQADADYQDAVTLAQINKDRLDAARAEVAKLKDERTDWARTWGLGYGEHGKTFDTPAHWMKRATEAEAEVAKLSAAAAQMREAIIALRQPFQRQSVDAQREFDAYIDVALATDAGRNYVDASGAVEAPVLPWRTDDASGYCVEKSVPNSWAGKRVLVMVKP